MKLSVKVITILMLVFVFSVVKVNASEVEEVDKVSTDIYVMEDDLSDYSDEEENNSGEYSLNTEDSTSDKYICYKRTDVELSTSSELTKSTDCYYESYNNKIVYSNNATFFQTIGGTELVYNMYPTLDDAANESNAVPISGAAKDGLYVDTVSNNNKLYAQIQIAGFSGYIDIDAVQIIPENKLHAYSHYEVQGDQLVFFEAVDPINSEEYNEYPLADAPADMYEGISYISGDGENFTQYTSGVTTYATVSEVNYTGANYFKYLSFRSVSSHTAAEYKGYLGKVNKTNSEYYNATKYFVEAQSNVGINSLLLYSMANNESAYGTSTYAKRCNNYFGRAAYDSDPNKACTEVGFPTPKDGIYSQALFLSQNYMDKYDWRYNGGYVGDKSSGMNMKYASDPYWGATISSIAYSVDKYYGSDDYQKYSLYKVNSSTPVYLNKDMKSKLTFSGPAFSGQKNGDPITLKKGLVITVIEEGDKYLSFYPDTLINKQGAQVFDVYDTSSGSYPTFNGRYNYNTKVLNNTMNFAVEFNSFYDQVAYIPFGGKCGSEYLVRNQTCTTKDGKDTMHEVIKNGDLTYKENTYYNTNDVITSYTRHSYKNDELYFRFEYTYTNGRLIQYYSANFNTSTQKATKTFKKVLTNGVKTYQITNQYDSKVRLTFSGTYNYYSSNGEAKNYRSKRFTEGQQTDSYYKELTSSQVKYYEEVGEYKLGKLYFYYEYTYDDVTGDVRMYYSQRYRTPEGTLQKTYKKKLDAEGNKYYEVTNNY